MAANNPFSTDSPPPVFGQPGGYDQAGGYAVPLGDDGDSSGDEPFTAAHLAAADGGGAVPAVPAAGGGLAFTESTAPPPAAPLAGRVGAPEAAPVPRVAADSQRLLGGGGGAPAGAAPLAGGPAGGGGGAGGPAAGGALAGAPPEDPSRYPFYNIKRYRGLFNVDTADVLWRLFRACLLFFRGDFLEYVGPNPDLYGPFWVASTAIFVTAATGNYASYLAWRHTAPEGVSHDTAWYYDVDKVGGSFALFYGYVGLVGLAAFLALRWFKAGVPLASVWCIYGYAVAAFIPIACVCVVPLALVRWVSVGVATLTSGTFIMLSLRGPIHDSAGAKAVPLYIAMIAAHAGLGLALKLYFYNY